MMNSTQSENIYAVVCFSNQYERDNPLQVAKVDGMFSQFLFIVIGRMDQFLFIVIGRMDRLVDATNIYAAIAVTFLNTTFPFL